MSGLKKSSFIVFSYPIFRLFPKVTLLRPTVHLDFPFNLSVQGYSSLFIWGEVPLGYPHLTGSPNGTIPPKVVQVWNPSLQATGLRPSVGVGGTDPIVPHSHSFNWPVEEPWCILLFSKLVPSFPPWKRFFEPPSLRSVRLNRLRVRVSHGVDTLQRRLCVLTSSTLLRGGDVN